MKRVWGISICLLLAVFLLSCSENDPFADIRAQGLMPPSSDLGNPGGKLRIMTYNVEDMDTGSGVTTLATYATIARVMSRHKVDVVAFQEVQAGSGTHDKYLDGSSASDGDTTYFNKALKAIPYIMPYFAFNNYGSIRLDFLATWSRFKIDGVSSIMQAEGSFDPSTGNKYRPSRPLLRFRVRYRGHDVWFYNCHLKSNSGGAIEQNAGNRRAQAFHLMRYIMRNQNPERDLIVILGDMNTMPEDFDGSGNSTIDYLCFRYDNPGNMANDFIPVNLTYIGAVTNTGKDHYGNWNDRWGAYTEGTTHPGNSNGSGYPDATFDHIILSPTLHGTYYIQGSIRVLPESDVEGGAADHRPIYLDLQF